MAGKEQIVEELGDLLLPNLVNQALVANDRAKYRMTLLQAAREHADHPDSSVNNLKEEHMACGVMNAGFDAVVERSPKEDSEAYHIPNVGRICDGIVEDLQAMLAPVESALGSREGEGERATEYRRRLEALTAAVPSLDVDLIADGYVDRITSARPNTGATFHLLVMNLHKELNRLQQQIASESIDGASSYGITEADRPMIAAFMRGLNRTRMLKFDHPGLDTTATRTDDRLVIQYYIGTTDAHVLVIHVTQNEVALTYTDVHLQRLLFFQNMLKRFPVRWEDTLSRRAEKLEETLYHIRVGRLTADREAQLADYLEFLGSRIVFLIDWNRARKRLRTLAPKRVGLEVLTWAAEHDVGHMAFLKVGGEQLVCDALQLTMRGPLQIGGRLSDIIGADSAAELVKFTLKTAAEGLLEGHSELLIRDQVRAELSHYLEAAHQGVSGTGSRACDVGLRNDDCSQRLPTAILRCGSRLFAAHRAAGEELGTPGGRISHAGKNDPGRTGRIKSRGGPAASRRWPPSSSASKPAPAGHCPVPGSDVPCDNGRGTLGTGNPCAGSQRPRSDPGISAGSTVQSVPQRCTYSASETGS